MKFISLNLSKLMNTMEKKTFKRILTVPSMMIYHSKNH